MSVETPTTSANELCQLCKKANHTAKNCPNLPKCQLCQKVGHTAHDCKRETVCQFCEAKGHGADTCWKLHGKSEGQTLLPPNKTTRLYGIANSPISTLGQTKIKISGIEIPFHAVPNSINMPQDGILGINFLCTNRAILNYSNKTLNINGWIIPVHLSTHRNSCLSIREDIGAEGNLINQSLLPDARVDRSQSINLHGIDGRSISSVGRAMINIYHTDAQFHVLPDEIDLIGDGILGSDFLVQTGAIIDFGKKILQIGKTTAPMYTKREVYTLNTDITELSTTSTCRLSDTFSHGTLTQEIITDFGVENTRDNSELYVFSSSAEGNLCDSGESRMQRLKSIIDTSHLDTSELDSIDSLLQEHSDRFYLEGDELPATNVVEHKITTVDDIPVNQKQYRLPHSLREEVKRQVDDLYKKGIIRHSLSPYSSALWVVPKKARADGKWRFRLAEFDFQIIYKEGKFNTAADALSRNPPETCEIRAVTRAQTQRANNLIPEPTQQVDSLEFPKGPITRAQARLANQTKKPNPQDIATPRKSDDDSPEIVTTPPDDSPEIVTAPLDQVASDKTTVSDIRPNEDPPEEPKGVDIDNEVRTLTPRPLSLVETKEPLELRQGAIMYFVNSKGLPLDASALGLEKLKRLDYEYHLDPGEVALVKDKRVAYQFVACLTHDGSQKRKFLGLTSQNLKKLANSLGLISWRYSKKFFKTRKLS
ncbi:hypothetical protein TKK_0009623 [Trichogramma kaykai]